MDDLDRCLVTELSANGRIPNNILAEKLGIAPSTCLTRTQRLIRSGVIRGFRADIDHTKLGGSLQAIVSVRVRPGARPDLLTLGQRLSREPGVQNVYFVAGAFDFVIHVVAADTEGLRTFVAQNLSTAVEIESTQTSLVFERFDGGSAPFPAP